MMVGGGGGGTVREIDLEKEVGIRIRKETDWVNVKSYAGQGKDFGVWF
jgi:hypothetical protein